MKLCVIRPFRAKTKTLFLPQSGRNPIWSLCLLFSVYLGLFPQRVLSIEFEDAIFPELATSGRALGMGNAFIAKVDDAAAVFYNPAGLGTVRPTHFHLSNFHIEFNKGWMDLATKGNFSNVASKFVKAFSLDGVRQLLLDDLGQISHTRWHVMPNFTTRYFSVGYLLSQQTRATIGVGPGAQFEFAKRQDHGPYAALNISILGGVFKLGISTILLNRNQIIDERDPNQTVDVQSGDYQKGTAAISTGGVRLTLPMLLLPTFAANIHNAFQQDFSARAAGAPPAIKNSIDLGFSITPQVAKIARIHLEVNYKDSGHTFGGVSSIRRTTFGAELDIARTFFLRIGYGDGFGSAGTGIRTKGLEFDLATYAVDTTTNEFRGREDRRFTLTISSGF